MGWDSTHWADVGGVVTIVYFQEEWNYSSIENTGANWMIFTVFEAWVWAYMCSLSVNCAFGFMTVNTGGFESYEWPMWVHLGLSTEIIVVESKYFLLNYCARVQFRSPCTYVFKLLLRSISKQIFSTLFLAPLCICFLLHHFPNTCSSYLEENGFVYKTFDQFMKIMQL